ncbi:MAG: hypothetical protein PGN13_09400 [Patulibacter minatonensis]
MLTLLAIVPLLIAIGFVGGFARSIRGTLGTLVLVGLVFAVPAGAGQSGAGVCSSGCGAAWVGPAFLAAAIIVPYVAGLGLRHRLEHTSAP